MALIARPLASVRWTRLEMPCGPLYTLDEAVENFYSRAHAAGTPARAAEDSVMPRARALQQAHGWKTSTNDSRGESHDDRKEAEHSYAIQTK